MTAKPGGREHRDCLTNDFSSSFSSGSGVSPRATRTYNMATGDLSSRPADVGHIRQWLRDIDLESSSFSRSLSSFSIADSARPNSTLTEDTRPRYLECVTPDDAQQHQERMHVHFYLSPKSSRPNQCLPTHIFCFFKMIYPPGSEPSEEATIGLSLPSLDGAPNHRESSNSLHETAARSINTTVNCPTNLTKYLEKAGGWWKTRGRV
jgi:hypothetical protein